jgi:hypothetical protein
MGCIGLRKSYSPHRLLPHHVHSFSDATVLTANRGGTNSLSSVIPEIEIWRVANLMLKRYGDEAEAESEIRADELAADGDSAGAAVWQRITDAIKQIVNTTRFGPMH